MLGTGELKRENWATAAFKGGFIDNGVGSKTLRLFTMHRIGSTGSHRPSGFEKTSVQKTGGVIVGSEGAG